MDGYPEVQIWTDGSTYTSNPGPGGWAALLVYNRMARIIGGYSPHSTNNAMETEAVAGALSALKRPCIVTIHTDSEYVRTGIGKILLSGASHKTNKEVWDRLKALIAQHILSVVWTRGHSDDPFNNLVDAYAGYCSEFQVNVNEYLKDVRTKLKERITKIRT